MSDAGAAVLPALVSQEVAERRTHAELLFAAVSRVLFSLRGQRGAARGPADQPDRQRDPGDRSAAAARRPGPGPPVDRIRLESDPGREAATRFAGENYQRRSEERRVGTV